MEANDGQCLNLVSFSAGNLECSCTDSPGQDNNNNNNNFILTPDSEVKLRSVVFTITITYSKTSRVKNCQYIHKLSILF